LRNVSTHRITIRTHRLHENTSGRGNGEKLAARKAPAVRKCRAIAIRPSAAVTGAGLVFPSEAKIPRKAQTVPATSETTG